MLILLTFFTYLKMTEDRSKRRFLSVIFTGLSVRKPLLIKILTKEKTVSYPHYLS